MEWQFKRFSFFLKLDVFKHQNCQIDKKNDTLISKQLKFGGKKKDLKKEKVSLSKLIKILY